MECIYKQERRKNEIITKFDAETSGNYKFADIWERLFSPTTIEPDRITPAGWSQKRVTWRRIRTHPLRDVSYERCWHSLCKTPQD